MKTLQKITQWYYWTHTKGCADLVFIGGEGLTQYGISEAGSLGVQKIQGTNFV